MMGGVARAALLLACALAIGCNDTPASPSPPPPTSTFLAFRSDAGDWVGQGQSHRYTLADGVWDARFERIRGFDHIVVTARAPNHEWWWTLNLSAPFGQPLSVGVYEQARDWPFQPPEVPGLDFSGTGRSCGSVVGRFEISALTIAHGAVDLLHVTFEQYCAHTSVGLRGELAVVANPWR